MTEAEMPQLVQDIRKRLEVLKNDRRAVVLFLSGDLGAGKTAFTKILAKGLGISEEVSSPTFVILKRYSIEIEGSLFKNLVHIDAYRLKGYEELVKIKFPDYLSNAGNLIVIEWPEMVPSSDLVPDLTVRLEHGSEEGERTVSIT